MGNAGNDVQIVVKYMISQVHCLDLVLDGWMDILIDGWI